MTTETITQEREWTLEEKMQTASVGTLLIHPLVFATGMYQGFQASRGNHGTSPFVPLWISNTLGTAYWCAEDQLERAVTQGKIIQKKHGVYVTIDGNNTAGKSSYFEAFKEHFKHESTKEIEQTRHYALKTAKEEAVKGSLLGAVLTPIEYLLGWGTGMAIGRINEVFS